MKNKKNGKGQDGFTLIELMVSVAIVALLAAFALPKYSKYSEKSAEAEALSVLGSAATEVEGSLAQNSAFPSTLSTVSAPSGWTALNSDATNKLVSITRAGGDNDGAVFKYDRNGGNWCWRYAKGTSAATAFTFDQTPIPASRCCNATCS
ncbi:MAG TPA: prepilin-type N-terminal cleavage/methylation domain-containing protein [Elusimicrobiota bacterium]|jgi:prepilin-type N-terminal cleavage/methylation domain-containing protein|nr:prepilin-type N-terminal cleavage/methylation domain-containing protein [Elusimicrobiota bacterium]